MKRGKLKGGWSLYLTIALTAAIVLILFVPVVLDPSFANGGSAMVCGPNRCTSFVQYDSISYAYGGWGAYFQTGVNYYTVNSWICNCPSVSPGHYVQCCIPPYAGIIWPVVYSLLVGAIVSAAVLIWKPWYQNHPSKA